MPLPWNCKARERENGLSDMIVHGQKTIMKASKRLSYRSTVTNLAMLDFWRWDTCWRPKRLHLASWQGSGSLGEMSTLKDSKVNAES